MVFTTEAFCSLFAETALDAASPAEFVDRAVDFANDGIWGTLGAGRWCCSSTGSVTCFAHRRPPQRPGGGRPARRHPARHGGPQPVARLGVYAGSEDEQCRRWVPSWRSSRSAAPTSARAVAPLVWHCAAGPRTCAGQAVPRFSTTLRSLRPTGRRRRGAHPGRGGASAVGRGGEPQGRSPRRGPPPVLLPSSTSCGRPGTPPAAACRSGCGVLLPAAAEVELPLGAVAGRPRRLAAAAVHGALDGWSWSWSTRGDRRLDVPIWEMGGKGVFAKEVQAASSTGGPTWPCTRPRTCPRSRGGPRAGRRPRAGRPPTRWSGPRWPASPEGAAVATGSTTSAGAARGARPDLAFLPPPAGHRPPGWRRRPGSTRVAVAGDALERFGLAGPLDEGLERVRAPPGRAGRAGRRVPGRRGRPPAPCSPRWSRRTPALRGRRAGLPRRARRRLLPCRPHATLTDGGAGLRLDALLAFARGAHRLAPHRAGHQRRGARACCPPGAAGRADVSDAVSAVVFDVGGVLLDWIPENLREVRRRPSR